MPTVPAQSYLRLTHTGLNANGTPNTSSILINDMDVGYEFQQRKTPVYVPYAAPGYIDVPLTSRVMYSVMQGGIAAFSRLGMIEVAAFSYTRDGDNLGGSGTGINLNAGVANNVWQDTGVLKLVINAGLDTSGMLVGERLDLAGLAGGYAGLDGEYTVSAFTKGFDFVGANPLAAIVSVTSAVPDIAQAFQGGVLLTLPDGMITHLYAAAGNAGGLGSSVRSYMAGDLVLTGTLDPIAVEFSATDMTVLPTNTISVEATTGVLTFKNSDGVLIPLSAFVWQPEVLSYITDNTLPPPLEYEGARYLLSTQGGTPNAAWDGAAASDIVQYTSGVWVATTPVLGMSLITIDTGKSYTYTSEDIWVEASGALYHNSLGGLQGGVPLERYHLTQAEHDDLTDGGETALHGHAVAIAAGAAGFMSGADKTKLDGITAGAAVASVGASLPITSTGGTTPTIGINAATTLAAGSMSAADKTKLDGITAGATNTPLTSSAPANVTKAAAVVGVATTAARADHKHDIDTGTPVTISTANAAGSGTALALANHVHDHGALAGGDRHAVAVAGVSAGFLSAADKAKLDSLNPVFASNFQTVVEEAATTTTSSTYTSKVTLVTGALTGTYRVGMYADITSANPVKRVQCRLYNVSDAVEYCLTDLVPPAAGVFQGLSGFNYVTLSGVSKNIVIQFASQDNMTVVSCQHARIEFWRVA